MRQGELNWLNQLIIPIALAEIVIYSLSVLCILASILIVSCILATQKRAYKNVAHIGWISALFMLMAGSVTTCFFSLVSMLLDEHCAILDYTERNRDASGLPSIYPDKMAPLMNTCLFGELKNAAVELNLIAETAAVNDLHASSKTYLRASETAKWNQKVWDNFLTQISRWANKPGVARGSVMVLAPWCVRFRCSQWFVPVMIVAPTRCSWPGCTIV